MHGTTSVNRPPKRSRRGLTIVELLVVIAIVGLLIALLLPAVQAAREAARRTACGNRLKQIGVAWLGFEANYGSLPSAGWGYRWIGDPKRGSGRTQPGSWGYSILPYLEELAVYEMPADGQPDVITAPQKAGAAAMAQVPLAAFLCPSRRPVGLFGGVYQLELPYNCDAHSVSNRSDYAANAGDQLAPCLWASGPDPASGFAGHGFMSMTGCNGITFQRSRIRLVDVQDGTSHTCMVGEKYLVPDLAPGTTTIGDDHSLFVADDRDMQAWARDGNGLRPPLRDRPGLDHPTAFGAAHPASINMVFCDGSVHPIAYDVDPGLFALLTNRRDRQSVSVP